MGAWIAQVIQPSTAPTPLWKTVPTNFSTLLSWINAECSPGESLFPERNAIPSW